LPYGAQFQIPPSSPVHPPPRWHHIYLPLLPAAFKDYLSAPMPFLVGLPGQLLPLLAGVPMDDALVLDLDLGRCRPTPGGEGDVDGQLLPWREQLEAALGAARRLIRSPTEHETSPLIASAWGVRVGVCVVCGRVDVRLSAGASGARSSSAREAGYLQEERKLVGRRSKERPAQQAGSF
jgi:hypothetical protein